ncbi:MAG: CRISPR-associated endonuclease Cas2 [Muribaculaceae bacterium]|nr:CRISPR-associated endonuclease Cas2 [Muribaculaceae bacterium]MCX4281036.1 CRISPR-associated endonuclease Cas2 [Muribaculaceae bacterium]ROS84613.1 CRISPR-associated endonuclease Cas2 [Muribaculaceae bacterium Isolate-036 (Harlan)]RXE68513.1 CRISPR-associated endonuclease Cas2 [Muribaculaceae bacterium Isolate-001 (NCI)]
MFELCSYERISAYQLMWILVMFDLPTETKFQRKMASDFRKRLQSDGFTMFQFSIYVRNCASRENTHVHVDRIKKFLPPEGKVCIISITERQFNDILLFEGPKKTDPMPAAIQLELF